MSSIFRKLYEDLQQLEENLGYLQDTPCVAFHHKLTITNEFFEEDLLGAEALLKYFHQGVGSLSEEEKRPLIEFGVISPPTPLPYPFDAFNSIRNIIQHYLEATNNFREQCEKYVNAGRLITQRIREYHYSPSRRGYQKAQLDFQKLSNK